MIITVKTVALREPEMPETAALRPAMAAKAARRSIQRMMAVLMISPRRKIYPPKRPGMLRR